MAKLTYDKLFDVSDSKPVDDIIGNIDLILNAFKGMNSALKKERGEIGKSIDSITDKAVELRQSIQQADETREDGQKITTNSIKLSKELLTAQEKNIDALGKNTKALESNNDTVKKLNKSKNDLVEFNEEEIGSLDDLKGKLKEAEKAYTLMGTAVDQSIKDDQLKRVADLSKQHNSLKKNLSGAKKSVDAAKGSYNELNKFVLDGRKRLKEMEGGLEGNSEEFEKLQKEVADSIVQLKEWDSALGDNFREVGNYKEAITGAIGEVDLFGKINDQVGGLLGQVAGLYGFLTKSTIAQNQAQKAVNKTTTFGTKVFRNFSKILKASGIGLIIAAFAGLAALFTQNMDGAKSLQKTLNGFKAFFNVLIGSLIKAGQGLVGFGTALKQVFKGDFLDASKTASQSMDQISNAFDGFGNRVIEQKKNLDEVTESLADFKKLARELEIQIAQLTIAEELNRAVSDAATLSFKEREKASLAAVNAGEQLRTIQVQLAQEELRLANLRLKIAKDEGQASNELLDEQLEAQKTLIDSEKELTLFLFEQQELRRQLKQDRLEKDLDILIDGFDNQKTINERLIADERASQRFRQELFEETTQLSSDSFDKQIETIQQFTNEAINANDLLAESDAIVLNEKIRGLGLSEIIEGRLLEVIRERRIVTQDLADIEKDIQDRSIANLEELANSEKALIDDRIQATIDLADARITILDDSLARGIVNEQEYADAVREINNQLTDDINALQIQRLEVDFDIQQTEFDTSTFNELIALNESFRNGEISSIEDFEKQKSDIEKSSQILRLQQEIEFLEKKRNLIEQNGGDVTAIDNQIAKSRLDISNLLNGQLLANEVQTKEAIKEVAQEAFYAAVDLANQIFEQKIAEDEAEIGRIDEKLAREIELAGNNDERKAQLEEDAQKKKDELQKQVNKEKRKQAKLNKTIAIVEIAINTAKGIANALGSFPPPASFIMAAITGVLGAAQIAAVASQKIPTFAKGTNNAPSGAAIINEEGPELITDSTGSKKVYNTDGPTLVNLKGGEKILPADKTKKYLEDIAINETFKGTTDIFNDASDTIQVINDNSAVEAMTRVLNGRFEQLEHVIKAKQENHFIFKNGELQTWVKNGENWNRFVNDTYN